MTDQICQLMEDVEGLCKRCYFLQKSNNELMDYLKDDSQLQEHIDENEKIIEKYHRKLEEILQMIKENSDDKNEFRWSPLSLDYRRMEEEEKRSCHEKRKLLLTSKETNQHSSTETNDDQGVFL